MGVKEQTAPKMAPVMYILAELNLPSRGRGRAARGGVGWSTGPDGAGWRPATACTDPHEGVCDRRYWSRYVITDGKSTSKTVVPGSRSLRCRGSRQRYGQGTPLRGTR